MIASNEHLCLIKSHILHEIDKLCRINTMFEDLILAIYLLMTKIFCECNCIFYGGRGRMVSVNIGHYGPLSTWIRPRTSIYRRLTGVSIQSCGQCVRTCRMLVCRCPLVSVWLLPCYADLGGVRVLPQFRAHVAESEGDWVYHC